MKTDMRICAAFKNFSYVLRSINAKKQAYAIVSYFDTINDMISCCHVDFDSIFGVCFQI